jgi:hypothetical protein
LELKPEVGGTLIGYGFQFTYRLIGGSDGFAVQYEPAAGKTVISQPFLKANTWQQLAMVVTENKIALYHDGRLVEELQTEPRASNWSLHTQSTWHRHPSFFGVGPGDMTLTKDEGAYQWTGQVRSLQIVRKALIDREIQAAYQANK